MTIRKDRELKEQERVKNIKKELIGLKIIGVTQDSIELSNGRIIYKKL